MRRLARGSKRVLVGLAGTAILLLGIIMIPYPGPGWLVVFLGLTVLGTEFDWAKRLHDFAHAKYKLWEEWLAAQPRRVQVIFWLLTAVIVVLTVWLINGYGMVNDWLNLDYDWVRSPWVR